MEMETSRFLKELNDNWNYLLKETILLFPFMHQLETPENKII